MAKFLIVPLLAFSLLAPFHAFWRLFKSPATPVDKASASIVRITGEVESMTSYGEPVTRQYICSGFVVAPKRILTAAHCVHEPMRADGQKVTVLLADQFYDLALLADDTMNKAPLDLRASPVVRGEALVGIGYGFGWTRLMSMQERVMLVNYAVLPGEAVGIIVQGGYVGGMSGGPVIDAHGLVVGIMQQSNAQVGYGVGTLLMQAFLLGVPLGDHVLLKNSQPRGLNTLPFVQPQ